jgi:hypothetical protein
MRGGVAWCVVMIALAVPVRAADPVVTYVAPGLYPARMTALNFDAWMDGQTATPQRLVAGHAITVKEWSVVLKANRMADFVLTKPYAARQQWVVRVRAACTATGNAASVDCALILARKGGIPDCALMVSDPPVRKRKKIVIECPRSVEFNDARS